MRHADSFVMLALGCTRPRPGVGTKARVRHAQLGDDDIRIHDGLLTYREDDIADEQASAVSREARLELQNHHTVLALAAIREGHPEACAAAERGRRAIVHEARTRVRVVVHSSIKAEHEARERGLRQRMDGERPRTVVVHHRPHKVGAQLACQPCRADANVALDLLVVHAQVVGEIRGSATLDGDRRRTAADHELVRGAASTMDAQPVGRMSGQRARQ